MSNPNKHFLREWTLAIRELGHPFVTEEEFKVAVSKLGAIKTGIPELDTVFTTLTTITGDRKVDLLYWDEKTLLATPISKPTAIWKSVAYYLRGGEINTGLRDLGTSLSISLEAETLVKSYLEYITPEYFNNRYNYDYRIAAYKYPDLGIKPQTGAEFKSKLRLSTIRMIESSVKQLEKKYPKQTVVNGMYSCLSMDSRIDIYDRLVDCMKQTNGCYLIHNSNGNIKSCKIAGRTCNPDVNKSCLCTSEKTLSGTSNPYAFMQYLLWGKKNSDADATQLLTELNKILATKLTDQTSLTDIMSKNTECAKVYKFQIQTYGKNTEPWTPCTVIPDAEGVLACDHSSPYYMINSANNALPTEYNTYKYQNVDMLDVFIDMSYGTQLDLMRIKPDIPIVPDKRTDPKPDPNPNPNPTPTRQVWLWVMLIGVIVAAVIVIAFVVILSLNKSSKHENMYQGYHLINSK